MAEPAPDQGPFPLAIPDDNLRDTVRVAWEARCNVKVWADADQMEQATGCGATWRWDGHQRGTLTCGPCGSLLVVDRLGGYTVNDLANAIGQRPTCRTVRSQLIEREQGTV